MSAAAWSILDPVQRTRKLTNVARYLLTKQVLKNELIVYYRVKGNADKQVPTKGDF